MDEQAPSVRKKTMSLMMSLILFVIVMMFAGWCSGYIVSRASGFWASFDLPLAFYVSTFLILLCSGGMFLALYFARSGKQQALTISLLLTITLSIGFGISQFTGWDQMFQKGKHIQGGILGMDGAKTAGDVFYYKGIELIEYEGQYYMPADGEKEYPLNDELESAGNNASSYFFVLTGMHLVHVILGLGLLVFISIKALKGRYGQENYLGIKLTGRYWHFMGGLWVFIMLFLYFIH